MPARYFLFALLVFTCLLFAGAVLTILIFMCAVWGLSAMLEGPRVPVAEIEAELSRLAQISR
jgi:hypothetical protein